MILLDTMVKKGKLLRKKQYKGIDEDNIYNYFKRQSTFRETDIYYTIINEDNLLIRETSKKSNDSDNRQAYL
jgi:hypothetical protein